MPAAARTSRGVQNKTNQNKTNNACSPGQRRAGDAGLLLACGLLFAGLDQGVISVLAVQVLGELLVRGLRHAAHLVQHAEDAAGAPLHQLQHALLSLELTSGTGTPSALVLLLLAQHGLHEVPATGHART